MSIWSVLFCSLTAASHAAASLAIEDSTRSKLVPSELGLYHRGATTQCTASLVVLRAELSPRCESRCWLQTSTTASPTATSTIGQQTSWNQTNAQRRSLVAQNLLHWNSAAKQQDNVTIDIHCKDNSDCTAAPSSLTLALSNHKNQQERNDGSEPYRTGCMQSIGTIISHTSRAAAVTAANHQLYSDLEAKTWLLRLGVVSSLAIIRKLC